MNNRSLVWLLVPAAFAMCSCGDAVPPPAEGTVNITIQNSATATAGFACYSAHTLLLGAAAPTPASQGSTWVDGQNGHSVACSVNGNDTFSVSGTIRGTGANFKVTGTVPAGGTGTASVYLFDTTMAIAMSDPACTLRVDGNYKIEKGNVFGAVSCSHLTSLDDNHLWCAANASFVFKSCSD